MTTSSSNKTKSTRTYIGIDFSMTSPAMAIYEGDPKKFSWTAVAFHVRTDSLVVPASQKQFWCSFYPIEPYSTSTQRFDHISNWALKKIKENPFPFSVGLEDYALGARGKVFEIAENTGMLKFKLFKENIPTKLFAPTTIKKFATGKGNSDKTKMYESWMKETNYDIQKILTPNRTKLGSPVSDIVDSYFILKYLISQESS